MTEGSRAEDREKDRVCDTFFGHDIVKVITLEGKRREALFLPALYSRITFSALHGRAAARTGFPQLQTDKISNTGKVRKGDMMYKSVVFLNIYLYIDHCQ